MTTLFQQKYPNVDVQLEYVPEQGFTQKVVAAAGTQTGPDLLFYGGDDILPWVQSGAIADLSTYWSTFADKDQFPAGVQLNSEDKLLGVKIYVNLIALYFNQDILDAVDVTPPTTMEEFDAALEKVAAADQDYVGYSLAGVSQVAEWVLWHMMSADGFSYDQPDAAVLLPQMERLASWVDKGYIPRGSANLDQQEAMAPFLTGNVAFVNNGNWRVNDLKAGAAPFNFGIVPLPTGTAGGDIYLGGEWQFLGGFSKNPDLAWEYLANSWFTQEGGLSALTNIGSIPSRLDVAPEAANEPLLQAFLTEIAERGVTYPPEAGVVSPLQHSVGEELSALIAGQQDAQTTTDRIVQLAEDFER